MDAFVELRVGNNMAQSSGVFEATQTVRQVLEQMNVPYGNAMVALNSSIISEREMDLSLAEVGATSGGFLTATIKTTGG